MREGREGTTCVSVWRPPIEVNLARDKSFGSVAVMLMLMLLNFN